MDDDGFRSSSPTACVSSPASAAGDEVARSLAERIIYIGGELRTPAIYQRLAALLESIDGGEGVLHLPRHPPGRLIRM